MHTDYGRDLRLLIHHFCNIKCQSLWEMRPLFEIKDSDMDCDKKVTKILNDWDTLSFRMRK